MKKNPKKWAVVAAIAAVSLCGTTVAASTIGTKMIEANYMGIHVVVDGKEIVPTDANGNIVEPFTSAGTTYLPVRAIGEALGKEVTWDAETATVYLGKVPSQTEKKNSADQAIKQALEQYRLIVARADSYSYSPYSVTPTGNYRYALIQLEPNDPVPTLLLSQEGANYSDRVRLFQYDPDTNQVIQPKESLEEYSGGGGYNSGLSLQGDGMGLCLTEISGGTGSTNITRITLSNGSLVREKQWSGRMDVIPKELSFTKISWHNITDTTALDSWTPVNKTTQQGSLSNSTADSTKSTLPTDGDRIVFTGTIDTYSYEKVIALQGCPDPNAPWSDSSQTFHLIVLDAPQEMKLQSGDPVSPPRSGMVRLISVAYAEGLDQYDGQHLTFSIDPNNTYWPSDTSMPVGQPGTRDVHVLK